MKKNLTKLVMLLFVIVFTYSCSVLGEEKINNGDSSSSLTRATYNMNRPPSKKAPGGLEPEQVPQFIIFGWDDNQFSDGMNNILDIYKGLTNPAGVGNPATFDGTPARASFYVTPGGRDPKDHSDEWEVSQQTIDAWKDAYAQGHEIGNHTYFHEKGGLQFTVERWRSEITRSNDWIVNKLGVPRAEITGFRTPFLEYNLNLFQALKEAGFEYDNSFEGGWRYWPAEDGSTLVFPYTMDNGSPAGEGGRDHGVVPGFWEVPTDCVFFEGGRTTGFDFNLWFSKSATKQQFVDMLKYTLHKKYYGNRAPMNFGAHTNYHSQEADDLKYYDPKAYALLKTTVPERNAAVKEFLEYALTLPGVRVVTTQQALEWQKNPTIMLGANKITVNAAAGANGSITPAKSVVNEGSNIVFTITPDSGYEVASVNVDGVPAAVAGSEFLLKNVRGNGNVDVTFRPIGSCPIKASFSVGSDWGSGFGANLTVTNTSETVVNGWELQLVFSGNQTVSGWGAVITQDGQIVTVKNSSGNGSLQPGQSVSIGLNGSYSGENLPPVVVVK